MSLYVIYHKIRVIIFSFTVLGKEMMLIAHTAFLFATTVEGASGKRYFSPYIN